MTSHDYFPEPALEQPLLPDMPSATVDTEARRERLEIYTALYTKMQEDIATSLTAIYEQQIEQGWPNLRTVKILPEVSLNKAIPRNSIFDGPLVPVAYKDDGSAGAEFIFGIDTEQQLYRLFRITYTGSDDTDFVYDRVRQDEMTATDLAKLYKGVTDLHASMTNIG